MITVKILSTLLQISKMKDDCDSGDEMEEDLWGKNARVRSVQPVSICHNFSAEMHQGALPVRRDNACEE
jgi:hypothetical protein